MKTIILHNPFDFDSQLLMVEAMRDDPQVVVINWYDALDRERYLEMGGTMEVSALPSVVHLSEGNAPYIIRLPASWAAAKAELENLT